MQENWQSVADALRASRLAAGMSQEELAERASTSRSTIQNLESGQPRKRISRRMQEIAAILGWPDGHIEQLLAGSVSGPPAKNPPLANPETSTTRTDLPFAVAHELDAGDLVDTKVIELEDSGARIIIVVRAAEGATPEQMSQALEEWKRMQMQIIADEKAIGRA
ncbi:XRE family transcriptional regulator [Streptomyces sp. ms191]|uniref:helix-turn-helix domain-containing protein n=1 Tax=Streptomyces sp. ms191 TaxID=1827978 RepID=UPI0011CD482C|nr:helix-turn-helix transcriptional regulator [Streptomyces sp. ms191]TXS21397.1 XRE family transcriptional regulator [Streptomyces sp. ms191]